MFDIGFSELVVVGVVALIVIGPERLPKVARTAGHLFGRFQRYVNAVKADINREMDLENLKKAGQTFKESVEEAARGVESRVTEAEFTMRDEVKKAEDEVNQTASELHQPVTIGAPEQRVSGDTVQLNTRRGSVEPVQESPAEPTQTELAWNSLPETEESKPKNEPLSGSGSGQDAKA